jgi:hypothetical protein
MCASGKHGRLFQRIPDSACLRDVLRKLQRIRSCIYSSLENVEMRKPGSKGGSCGERLSSGVGVARDVEIINRGLGGAQHSASVGNSDRSKLARHRWGEQPREKEHARAREDAHSRRRSSDGCSKAARNFTSNASHCRDPRTAPRSLTAARRAPSGGAEKAPLGRAARRAPQRPRT